MHYLSLLFFSLCMFAILLMFRKGSDVLSPGRLFGIVWTLALGLSSLKLSALQHEWSLESWLVILLGVLGFLAGSFLSYVQNLDQPQLPLRQMREALHRTLVYEKRLYAVILSGFIAYCFSYAAVYLIKGFIPIFSMKGAVSRVEFQVFGFGILLHSVVFITYLSVLYHVYVRTQRAKKVVLQLVCLITAVTFFFLLQRFQLVMSMLMIMSLLYYTTSKLRLRNALIFFILIVAFFYWVSSIRGAQLLQQYLYLSSKMRFSSDYAFLTEPYMYMVMNLENLARGIDRLESFTFGYYSLDFLMALTGLKHWLADYFALDPLPFLNSGYNTYSSFWSYYRDFGVFGLAMIEFSIGWGVGQLYASMRQKPSLQKVSAYSAAIFTVIMSFFMTIGSLLWFVFNLVVIILALRFIVQPSKALVAAGKV